jgi:hypothetical protein
MYTLNQYIELLETRAEMDVVLNFFDLHKKDHSNYLKIKRQLLKQLHYEGASPQLVRLALICFILAKMPTLEDVATAYEYYVPLTNLSDQYAEHPPAPDKAFQLFCEQYPDAHSCRIYDV